MKRFVLKWGAAGLLGMMCILSCFPVLLLLVGSVTSQGELLVYLQGMFGEGDKVSFLLFPAFPTLKGFLELFLDSPEFYVMFWNSAKLAGCILAGQMLVSVPAAWGFSRWHGKVGSLLFSIYTVLMLLPFQVTMLSNYTVIQRLGMLDTHAAIIWPAVFSTFPVFLVYRYFIGIPEEIYEAFSLESSSRLRLFSHIGVPMAMPGVKAALLLGGIEYWNMVEQPILFLKTPSLWPYSLCLPEANSENISYLFAFSLAVLAPMCLVMFWGREEIQEGIGALAPKDLGE